MDDTRPLSGDEEIVWRAISRLLLSLPRALDADLGRESGLSLTEHAVLVHLSEAPGRQLRMSDLAARTALSASRVTRLVDDLGRAGLVEKTRSCSDRRGAVAALTDAGLGRLTAAYDGHLASVRRHLIDRLDPDAMAGLGAALARTADALDSRAAPEPGPAPATAPAGGEKPSPRRRRGFRRPATD